METRPFSVLIVDDEESILRALERVLRADHHRVTCVFDPVEALKLLESEHFDLVISDQRMPAMSGTELLSKVRSLYPLTGRVMISGYADFESIMGAINEAQVAYFIPKPWDNFKLRTDITRLLEANRAALPGNLLSILLSHLPSGAELDWELGRSSTGFEFTVDFYERQAKKADDQARALSSVPVTVKMKAQG